MKPSFEEILEKTGLWEQMWHPIRQKQITTRDAETLGSMLAGKVKPAELEGHRVGLAESLRWAVYKTCVYISALSYLIFQQRLDYYERSGQAGIERSLLMNWLGIGVYHIDSLRDVVDRLDELSLKFTLQELLEAQYEASIDLVQKLPLYNNRREVNAAFKALGVRDYFTAAWKPHTVGLSFIFAELTPVDELGAAVILGTNEFSRSVNMHAGLARSSMCSHEDVAHIRRAVLSRIYDKSGIANSDSWLVEVHEKRTKALKRAGLELDILDESVMDAHFHGAPYLPKYMLHGNAYWGQVGLADAKQPEASVYELSRTAMQAFHQLAVSQAVHFQKTQPQQAGRLLYLALIRSAKDHCFSRSDYHGSVTLAVSLNLLRYISEKKTQVTANDIRKFKATMAILRKTYQAHRSRLLARVRRISFHYGSEKLPLSSLVSKVSADTFQPGMSELDVCEATWEQIRQYLKRDHWHVLTEIFSEERKTRQTLINRMFEINYDRKFEREKPLPFFWEYHERLQMKRSFPGLF